ncbi:helix-turn-helix domain-containing protein [Streptomyces orinoci]|uniref:Helix-turn-helix transcriptional regulator n=1 Tax=Streptomyces orinoci TaxID=67339 RepID=A0ABV3K5S1_STRON|nr:helix-turn-helix transcriptional regulator [Streptomyces orinoci]
MPPRSAPTVRQRRLGAELRRLREAAGVTTQEAAALLGVDRTRIPNLESGRFGISSDRVRTLALKYGCADAALVEALANMAEDRGRHWWESYRGLLPPAFQDVAELEHHANAMRMFVMVHIPGLLQTAEHARAVFEKSLAGLSPREIELRVAHRMRRQEILTLREPAPPFTAIIHEAALRMQFGGVKVARRQLVHLLEMSERDTIILRVLAFASDGFAGPGQPIFYAHGPVPQLDTVQLDNYHGAVFVDSAADLAGYRRLLDETEMCSLLPGASRDLIHSIIRQL